MSEKKETGGGSSEIDRWKERQAARRGNLGCLRLEKKEWETPGYMWLQIFSVGTMTGKSLAMSASSAPVKGEMEGWVKNNPCDTTQVSAI